MKKTILFLCIVGLGFASCTKKKTCTCNDPSGNTISQSSIKSSSKTELKKFEDACKKRETSSHTTTGSGFNLNTTTTITPCTLS